MAIIVALFVIVAGLLAAFAIDIGAQRELRRGAQNAADAAALAGAGSIYATSTVADYSAATTAVKDLANRNLGTTAAQWASCVATPPTDLIYDTTTSGTPCIAFGGTVAEMTATPPTPAGSGCGSPARSIGWWRSPPSLDTPSARRARAPRHPSCPAGRQSARSCVLGPQVHDTQNGELRIANGDVHFNGSHDLRNNGSVVITTVGGRITIQGTSGPTGQYGPPPLINQAPIPRSAGGPDPPPPSAASLPLGTLTSGCPVGPGRFGDVNYRNRTCTLPAGLYVITGKWDMAGNQNTQLYGTGVSLYFTCGTPTAPQPCTTGQQGGWIDASGNAAVVAISAPTSGDMKGLALAYDRNNTSDIRLTGNGASNYTGTIYAKSSKMVFKGNGCGTQYQSLTVVGNVEMDGNNACFSAKLPRVPECGNPSRRTGPIQVTAQGHQRQGLEGLTTMVPPRS